VFVFFQGAPTSPEQNKILSVCLMPSSRICLFRFSTPQTRVPKLEKALFFSPFSSIFCSCSMCSHNAFPLPMAKDHIRPVLFPWTGCYVPSPSSRAPTLFFFSPWFCCSVQSRFPHQPPLFSVDNFDFRWPPFSGQVRVRFFFFSSCRFAVPENLAHTDLDPFLFEILCGVFNEVPLFFLFSPFLPHSPRSGCFRVLALTVFSCPPKTRNLIRWFWGDCSS